MDEPLRALLLAAGLGTRLKPLTETMPKCLVTVGGEPLLENWLNKLEQIGCEKALVNTHYLADQVQDYLNRRRPSIMKIVQSHEVKLLGTAGTLLKNIDFFKNTIGLLIHADNATKIELKELISAHKKRPKNCLLTMLTFETEEPSNCGIVEIDDNRVVTAFHEKKQNPPGNRANGAVYVFSSEFISFIKGIEPDITDFSNEILPMLIRRIYTYHTTDPYLDIGTRDRLLKARKLWADHEKPDW